MRGYEDLDEYEDDGFVEHDDDDGFVEHDDDDGFIDRDDEQMYEDEGGEEEEEAQEEVRKPTKEEMDFLKVRQQIKETMRKQMKKENASATGNSQERKRHNYGSFFGPSQPVIAQRVIQESKSLLENPHLAARILNPRHSLQNKKSPGPAKATPRPGVRERPLKVVSMEKQKARIFKDTRDYSFLHSEDAELPAPTKMLPPRTGSVPNSDARSAQLSSKSPKSVSSTSRPVLNGREQRPVVSVGHQVQNKPGQHKPTPGTRPDSASGNHRKQLGSSIGNGPGRIQGTNGFPPKPSIQMKPSTLNKTSVPDRTPRAHTTDRNVSSTVGKRPQSDVRKTVLPRPHPSISGLQKPLLNPQPSRSGMQRAPSKPHPYEQRRDFREPDRSRLPKQPVPSSSAPKAKTSKHPSAPKDRRRNRSMSPGPDDVRQMVRNMFGYNPNRYGNDEDDSSMEVGFNDIMREERHSSRIAHEEDERERLIIEKEEREERMRKKRRLSSH